MGGQPWATLRKTGVMAEGEVMVLAGGCRSDDGRAWRQEAQQSVGKLLQQFTHESMVAWTAVKKVEEGGRTKQMLLMAEN